MSTPTQEFDLAAMIRDVPDFPQPGILFKDITTLIKHGPAFRYVIDRLVEPYLGQGIDGVVGIESRGFIFAAPLADRLGAGFVPVRKPGKLPSVSIKREYELEYGTNVLEIHRDGIEPGQRILIVDDVLATGGSASATAHLVEELGGSVAGIAVVAELAFLHGRERLGRYEVRSLVQF
ncbi:MAG TPA: adenine phosphoribosyltransferase [Chloroflexota bacterium]|jgi:adenine phosphoribosyltransferase|nr:adenine phosphoribosyltransferase [Chloroflexota bacterium]